MAPLGYGNAITENALLQNRASKKGNKENNPTPTLGTSSNIVNKENNQSEAASKITTSTTNSSEYFDSKDDLNNSSIASTVSPEITKDNSIEVSFICQLIGKVNLCFWWLNKLE